MKTNPVMVIWWSENMILFGDSRTKTGRSRTRINKILKIPDRSRTIEILKISNHFEPIGPRSRRSVNPWSCCSAEASRIGTRRVVPEPFAIIVHPPNSPLSLKWLNRWDVFDDRGKKHLTTSWPRPEGGKIRFSSCLCHYAYHVI